MYQAKGSTASTLANCPRFHFLGDYGCDSHTCHNQLAVPLTIFQKKILAERVNVACIRPYIAGRARDQRCCMYPAGKGSLRGLVEYDIKVVPVPSELFTQIQWDFNIVVFAS